MHGFVHFHTISFCRHRGRRARADVPAARLSAVVLDIREPWGDGDGGNACRPHVTYASAADRPYLRIVCFSPDGDDACGHVPCERDAESHQLHHARRYLAPLVMHRLSSSPFVAPVLALL